MALKRWLLLLILISIIIILTIAHSNRLDFFFFIKYPSYATIPKRWNSRSGSDGLGKTVNSLYHGTTNSKGPGYVLVAEYADQMTGASFSILSLQCWAGTVSKGLRVVEPFLHTGSGLGYTFGSRKGAMHRSSRNQVKLRDIIDLKKWQKQLENKNSNNSYSMLDTWKEFVKLAPRDLIIVGRDCNKTEYQSCNSKFYKAVKLFAAKQGFRIVREVQIERIVYSSREFEKLIYGTLDPNGVVVFFRQWGGIVSKCFNRRYAISGIDQCQRHMYRSFLFETSERNRRDSSVYMSRFLSEGSDKYISVMLRMERFGLKHFKRANSQEEKMIAFTKCQVAIEREVRNMKTIHNTSGLFLAMDTRKHGSRGIRNHSAPPFMDNTLLDVITRQTFDTLKPYGNSFSTLEEWDASFDNISSIQAPGYVAQLQKNLAASGRCLITAGGGSFQESARLLYTKKHGNTKARSHCVVNVPECF